jgi:hypothetical protein
MSLLRSFGNILACRVYKYFVPTGLTQRAAEFQNPTLPILRRRLSVFELFFPPPVSALLDQLVRGGEIFLWRV